MDDPLREEPPAWIRLQEDELGPGRRADDILLRFQKGHVEINFVTYDLDGKGAEVTARTWMSLSRYLKVIEGLHAGVPALRSRIARPDADPPSGAAPAGR